MEEKSTLKNKKCRAKSVEQKVWEVDRKEQPTPTEKNRHQLKRKDMIIMDYTEIKEKMTKT